MNTFWWSVGLFVIGIVEFLIDQTQKVHLSRLKLWQTIFWQLLNKWFEFIVQVYVFSLIVSFQEEVQHGIYNWHTLIPFFVYQHGCVAGTGIALWMYIHQRRKKDQEKAIKYLEGKTKKKRKGSNKKSKKAEVVTPTPETMMDPVELDDLKSEIRERAVEAATQKITDKIEEAFPTEGSK